MLAARAAMAALAKNPYLVYKITFLHLFYCFLAAKVKFKKEEERYFKKESLTPRTSFLPFA
jgi:hypothetical protein